MSKERKLFPSFYFDEDVSIIVARIMRAHGFDVVCAVEAQLRSKSDEEQLRFAVKEGKVFVTHNIKDFLRLHKDYIDKDLHHHGIILAIRRRNNYDFTKRLLGILQQIGPADLNDQIRFI